MDEREFSNEVLELVYNQDEFTTSDLQGAVLGLWMKLKREGLE